MNIELDEVVVQSISDDALEQAAGDSKGGQINYTMVKSYAGCNC
ncbi:hypothetical protein [Zwartia hollandica]|jgi:hypothetical protein|nr:hypothetical protein [Zwartia hollandica]